MYNQAAQHLYLLCLTGSVPFKWNMLGKLLNRLPVVPLFLCFRHVQPSRLWYPKRYQGTTLYHLNRGRMPVSVHGSGGMPSPFLVAWAGWLLPGCYPPSGPDCRHVRWTAVHLLDAGYRFPLLLSSTYRRGRWPFLFYHAT